MSEEKIKSLFMAQYLHQKVYTCKDWECFNDKSLNEVDPTYLQCGSNRLHQGYLLLRDVSQLTEIQVLEIALLRGYQKRDWYSLPEDELKWIVNEIRGYLSKINYNEVRTCITDYLRLNGFITAFTYLSENNTPVTLHPDELVKRGWVKLKTA